jgi:hypothetical protein
VSRSDLPQSGDGPSEPDAAPSEQSGEPANAEPAAEAAGADAGVGPAAAEAGGEPTGTAEPVGGKRAFLLITAAAVVVLAVIGVAIYMLVNNDDTGNTAAGQVPTIENPGGPVPTTSATTPPPPSSTPPMSIPSSTSATTGVSTGGGDAGDAQSVAEQAVTAISTADVNTLAQLSCDPTTAGGEDTFPAGAKAEVVGEPKVSGDTASIDVKLTFDGAEPAVVPMPLTKKDGRWCIP